MALVAEQKGVIIEKFRLGPKDVGSSDVQIALLTERITHLTEHLKSHRKDQGCRRGLLILVSKRRRLLKYLKRTETERYRQLIEKLGIRR
jgi:small subunit ribosomal protein S15